MKALVEKTFAFVELVWSVYVVDNKPDVSDVLYIILYLVHISKLLLCRPIEDEEPSDPDGEEI